MKSASGRRSTRSSIVKGVRPGVTSSRVTNVSSNMSRPFTDAANVIPRSGGSADAEDSESGGAKNGYVFGHGEHLPLETAQLYAREKARVNDASRDGHRSASVWQCLNSTNA